MTTNSFDLLASSVLTSNASTVTFGSISGLYRDLILVCDIVAATTTMNLGVRFNADNGNNYFALNMRADSFGIGSSLTTQTEFRLTQRGDGQPSTTRRTSYMVQIFDYAEAKGKPILSKTNNSSITEIQSGRWANTSTITSVSIVGLTDSFGATSKFYLYGVLA